MNDFDTYLTNFNLPNPDYGISVERELDIIESSFGDGYKQEVPVGINYSVEKLQLTWTLLEQETAEKIMEFFIERGGYKPFRWTPETKGITGTNQTDFTLNPHSDITAVPPISRKAVQKVWKAKNYRSEIMSYMRYHITVEFIQDFTPI